MSDAMPGAPTISVVLPAFNAKDYVEASVVSILQQTFTDFELILIDDGSTDGTTDVLKRLAKRDNRIVFIGRENRGLVTSLNQGLSVARGEYIARMDADDVALPERFAKQVQFLCSTGYAICGTAVQCFGATNHLWRYPKTPEEVEIQLLFDSPYAHPTVMFVASIFKTLRYRESCFGAEDYDLWQRAWSSGAKGGNLEKVLLRYRVHDVQVSSQNKEQQRATARSVRRRHWGELLEGALDNEISHLLEMLEGRGGDLATIEALLKIVIFNYDSAAKELFLQHAFRISVKSAATSQNPALIWRTLLGNANISRNIRQELLLYALQKFNIRPQGYLFERAKKHYLNSKWR